MGELLSARVAQSVSRFLKKKSYLMYSSTWSAWFRQDRKTSWTPALARKSRVYSIKGVFASSRRHYMANLSNDSWHE